MGTGFENCRSWLADVRAHADPHLTCILVGNKVDLCAPSSSDPSSSNPSSADPSSPPAAASPPPPLAASPRKGGKARAVPTEEGAAFADAEGLLFTEASAKSGEGVQRAFEAACVDILSKIGEGVFDDDRVRAFLYLPCFCGGLTGLIGVCSRRG